MEVEEGGLLGVTWHLVGMSDDFGAFLPVLVEVL
jgi:hypothetical protein